MDDTKTAQQRIRRAAARQGYALTKSRTRDPLAVDFGRYALVDPETGREIFSGDIAAIARRLERVA